MTNPRRMQMAAAGAAGVEEGALYGWGLTTGGQIGLDSGSGAISVPTQVGAVETWVKGGQGGQTSDMAVRSDGTLWAWGTNPYGELGQGNTTLSSTPVQVGSGTDWLKTGDVRDNTVCSSAHYDGGSAMQIIKSDGTLWGWGRNVFGVLGQGNTTDYSSPVQVGSGTDWIQIANGASHIVALKSGGTMWTWGHGFYGALGLGANDSESSPVQVGSLTTWRHVGATSRNTYAVKTDNTLWAMGQGSNGEVGDGTTNNRNSPVQIGTSFSRVYGSRNTGMAIKTDGTLWAWGNNSQGMLGLGDTTKRSEPIQVGSLSDYYMCGHGGSYTNSFLRTDSSLWTVGKNTNGLLGNDAASNESSPVQIGTDLSWKFVDGGATHMHAITGTI